MENFNLVTDTIVLAIVFIFFGALLLFAAKKSH